MVIFGWHSIQVVLIPPKNTNGGKRKPDWLFTKSIDSLSQQTEAIWWQGGMPIRSWLQHVHRNTWPLTQTVTLNTQEKNGELDQIHVSFHVHDPEYYLWYLLLLKIQVLHETNNPIWQAPFPNDVWLAIYAVTHSGVSNGLKISTLSATCFHKDWWNVLRWVYLTMTFIDWFFHKPLYSCLLPWCLHSELKSWWLYPNGYVAWQEMNNCLPHC
jgi:hypothetical protein